MGLQIFHLNISINIGILPVTGPEWPGTAATIYSSAFTTQDDKCILGDYHAQNTKERIFRLLSDQEILSAFSDTALGWLFPLRTYSLETDGNPVAVRMIWSARLFPVHWVKKQPVKRASKETTESLTSSWEWIRSSQFVLYYNGIHEPASVYFCAKNGNKCRLLSSSDVNDYLWNHFCKYEKLHTLNLPSIICLFQSLYLFRRWKIFERCDTSLVKNSLVQLCSWWRHQMGTFSALLALGAGNSPVTGEFPWQRTVTRSFDIFFDLRLSKRLTKQSWGWWLETLSFSLRRHFNAYEMSRMREVFCIFFLLNCSQQFHFHAVLYDTTSRILIGMDISLWGKMDIEYVV